MFIHYKYLHLLHIIMLIHVHVNYNYCMYILLFVLFSKALESAFFLHEKGQGEEAKQQYLQLAAVLEEFIGKNFNDWVVTVEKELTKLLDQPLMLR